MDLQRVISKERADEGLEDPNDPDYDDTKRFDFKNAHNHPQNYLNLSTLTLDGMIKNERMKINMILQNMHNERYSDKLTAACNAYNDPNDSSVPTTVRAKHELYDRSGHRGAPSPSPPSFAQEDMTKALNVAMMIKESTSLNMDAQKLLWEFLDLHHVIYRDGPKKLEQKKKDLDLIKEAYKRVATKEWEVGKQKREDERLKKEEEALRKFEEKKRKVATHPGLSTSVSDVLVNIAYALKARQLPELYALCASQVVETDAEFDPDIEYSSTARRIRNDHLMPGQRSESPSLLRDPHHMPRNYDPRSSLNPSPAPRRPPSA